MITLVSSPDDNWKEFAFCYNKWLRPSLEAVALKTPQGNLWVTHEFEHVWKRVRGGQALFWRGEECAFVTEVYQSPTGLRSHHNWLAGGTEGGLDEIVEGMPQIEGWGREHGCHRQTGSGRRAWLRKFVGYEEIGVRKQKSLLVGPDGKPLLAAA